MSSDEEYYSDFLNQLSNLSVELSLFSGFTFTIITILLTMLPGPSTLSAQIALFFLVMLLDLFIFFARVGHDNANSILPISSF